MDDEKWVMIGDNYARNDADRLEKVCDLLYKLRVIDTDYWIMVEWGKTDGF